MSTGAYRTFLVLAGLGTVLTAAYMLGLVRRLCMGPVEDPVEGRPAVDVTGREIAVWTPLVALTLVAGLWPASVLAITDPAVRALMGGS